MADNVSVTSGSYTDTIAADDVGGAKWQRVKLGLGADGAASDMIPVVAGMDSNGAGLAAAAVIGQLDDTSTATVTENQFAPVRISSRRALRIEGVSGGDAVPASIADGSDAAEGAIADAIVAAGATGSISAKLRRATQGLEDLKTLITLAGIVGAGTIAAGQISVDTTTNGKQIVSTRTGRRRITITNLGNRDVYIGPSGVTTSNGALLKGTAGASMTIETTAAVYGIVASSTQSVSYLEEY